MRLTREVIVPSPPKLPERTIVEIRRDLSDDWWIVTLLIYGLLIALPTTIAALDRLAGYHR